MNVDDMPLSMAFIYEKDAGQFIAHLTDHFRSLSDFLYPLIDERIAVLTARRDKTIR